MQVDYAQQRFFNIICKYKQKLYQIKEILTMYEISQIKNLDENEWAYVFIYSNTRLIIPCKFIVKKFYCQNKIMEKALLSGYIQNLFDNYSFESLNVIIDNIKGCSNITTLLIARILFDKRIEDMFYYHFFQISITKNLNLNLLKSFFPTFGEIHINGKFTKLQDDIQKDIYILESFSNYTNLDGPFNDILYFDYSNKTRIRKKFSSLIDKKMDWNKVYFLSNETYLLNKSYFYTKYLSFESYLINLDCNILYVSQVKYLHEYLHNFNNYDKFTIENHCFYYILFSFQSIKYLIILFNTCDLENIWIFENFNIEIDGIENFIRIIFQYIYMR